MLRKRNLKYQAIHFYLAVSYDHRIIDGREAVLGLVAMKEALEDPARLLLDL